MAKRLISDMIVPETRGAIRKITEPTPRRQSFREDIPFGENKKSEGGILKSLSVILLGAIVLFGLFFFLTSYFTSAEVFATAVKQSANLDNLVSMVKDKSGAGKIKYSLMKLLDFETSNIPATGNKSVNNYAKGKVTLYNAYSASIQKLAIGTRLETVDGKIYKINSAVVIPGAKGTGANLVPGQISVAVTSSLPGAGFNIPPSSFTIPGFKGGVKYSKIYAKSLGDIVGGFVGTAKIVSPEDVNKARATLSETLKQKLLKKAIIQVPLGYVFYDGAYSLNLKDNAIDSTYLSVDTAGNAQYKLSGVLNAVIIEEKSLNDYILADKLPGADNSNVIIRGARELSMTILNKDKVDIASASGLSTRLSGPIEFIWNFDAPAISARLIGVKKADYEKIFKEFPSVKRAVVKFSPSWAWSFPGDAKKIRIIKDFEQNTVK